jgi:hypothetical protein
MVQCNVVMEDRRKERTSPKGVIGCLSAGFELLSRNLGLIILPVLLDLLLWWGPRISIAPLLKSWGSIIATQSSVTSDAMLQVDQVVEVLELIGEQFNLLSLLGGLPLLQVPSLLVQRAPGGISPLGEPIVFSIANILALAPWWAGLVLFGLLIGAWYLNGLAQRVCSIPSPAVEKIKETANVDDEMERLFRAFMFGVVLLIGVTVVVFIWLLMVALAAVVAQMLGTLVWLAGGGLIGYAVLHLMFVPSSLLLGGRSLLRAMWESMVLTHSQLSSVLGLVLVAVVIYEGLGFAWSLPGGDSWTLLIGIVGNAAIATGLTVGVFVFYREQMAHLLRQAE